MNYSAARLPLQVFPTHFSHDQAIAMQHNPRAIADQAYGSRMGAIIPEPMMAGTSGAKDCLR